MSEPDWAKILRVMYRGSPRTLTTTVTEDHPFVTMTDLDAKSANTAAMDLERWGLLDTKPINITFDTETLETVTEDWGYELSNDGFNVVHERELSHDRNRINHAIVFLTFFLVLAEIVGVVPIDDLSKGIGGFIILVGMMIVVVRTDLLER